MRQGLILPNKLVLEQIEKKEVVKGSIIIPTTAQKNETLSGRVVLVGAKCETIKEGMTVLYPRLSATKFNLDSEPDRDYFLLPESSVLFAFYGE